MTHDPVRTTLSESQAEVEELINQFSGQKRLKSMTLQFSMYCRGRTVISRVSDRYFSLNLVSSKFIRSNDLALLSNVE